LPAAGTPSSEENRYQRLSDLDSGPTVLKFRLQPHSIQRINSIAIFAAAEITAPTGFFSSDSRLPISKLSDDSIVLEFATPDELPFKVDCLSRSLADFAKIVEIFDAHGVSFVAVTQQFNTTTSMGRLTLNVLLSFAQFDAK
jgi:hypothetical protein